MSRISLSKEQIEEIVFKNRQKVDEKFLSPNLDELSLIVSTGESFGFEVDKKSAREAIIDVIGEQQSEQDKYFNGAILQIRGEYSLSPFFSLNTDRGGIEGKMFVFHETSLNKLHRILSRKLIANKAVKLFPGCDEEYLYEVLLEGMESYLFERLKQLASGLPIYLVEFKEDASFTVEEMGKIDA
ncbi:hypothetical protein HY357_00010 [Candidatus Roizmanbacteria bacterium]|nr:hypothetical protein [Candidatus Roizmanbacteria bacterium]